MVLRVKRWMVSVVTALAVFAVSVVGIGGAYADPPASTRVTLPGIFLNGIGPAGSDGIEAYEAPASEGGASQLTWCVQIWSQNPTADTAVTGVDRLVTESKMWGPAEMDLTTSQMAWLLDRVNKDYTAGRAISRTEVGAIGYLVHANFEMDDPGSTHPDAQANVDLLTRLVQQQHPAVWARASVLAAQARNSAAVGYASSQIPQERVRHGHIKHLGVTNQAGTYLPGIPMKIVLDGPAVFDATGTKEWTGTSQSTPVTLEWTATGNGTVSFRRFFKGRVNKLTNYQYGAGTQNTLSLPKGDPHWEEEPGRVWRVVYDFQPVLTSNVREGKVSADSRVVDRLSVVADSSYSHGEWIVDDSGQPVPVVFEGRAYDTGDHPAPKSGEVPVGARLIGTTRVQANGPGEYEARLDGVVKDPSFVTWVWSMKKADQTSRVVFGGVEYSVSDLVHADWHDEYGLDDETLVNPWTLNIDSSVNTHITKSGTYLSDDLFITGMPEDHPNWEGSHGFRADVKTLTQSLLFFPDGLDVTEANKTKAEVIGSVEVLAKNGFYPNVGSTRFKVKDSVVGTYVFVTSFSGDDRVSAFSSSVEDVREQYVVEPEIPTLQTTATDKGDGDKTLDTTGDVTIQDRVCYTNLVVGRQYELTGTLMDKDTQAPITGEDGQPLTSTITHTPSKSEDCVDVDFTVQADILMGKTTVVFERLTYKGRILAVHTDINDEGQTVTTPPVELRTTATDQTDGDKNVNGIGPARVNDRVCYTNLVVGKEYELTGTLMDKDTQAPITGEDGQPLTSSVTHTPSKSEDCVDVAFVVDASRLHGKSVVVFESFTHQGRQIAAHADINDEGQTVRFTGSDFDQGLASTGAPTIAIIILALFAAIGGISVLALRRMHARCVPVSQLLR